MSNITFKATSRSVEGLVVESESSNFKLTIDEPVALGGTNTGMNPVEALLCSLGSCQVIVARVFAKANGIEIDEFRVEIEGDIDPDGFILGTPGIRNGFSEIRTKMYIKTKAQTEKVKAFAKFIEGRCPVGDTIITGTPINNSIVVED